MSLRLRSQFCQKLEAVEACAMPVAEVEADRVVANFLPTDNQNAIEVSLGRTAVLLAKNVAFTLRFGAR